MTGLRLTIGGTEHSSTEGHQVTAAWMSPVLIACQGSHPEVIKIAHTLDMALGAGRVRVVGRQWVPCTAITCGRLPGTTDSVTVLPSS
eukprot:412247-Amphidinium_carterae.1